MSEIVTVLTTIEQLEAQGTAPRLVLDRVKRDCRDMLDDHDRGMNAEYLRQQADGRLERLCADYQMGAPSF
jgi:hypothetical protein